MPKLKTTASAKINLTFDILGTLPDGYHRVETLLQSIDLADELVFDIEESSAVSVTIENTGDCPSAQQFPIGPENLIAKAVKCFAERSKRSCVVNVSVQKVIPIGAGLAGGSADAAATLVALNHALGKPLSDGDLLQLGAELGADVPFCLQGGTSFGTNRGDQLAPCPSKIALSLCVVKPPDLSVSTQWAYKKFDDFHGDVARPDAKTAITALASGNTELAIQSFGNVFEPVIFAEYPALSELKQTLQKHQAWHVQLSGSGPALFAIVADIEQAHYVRRNMLSSELEFHLCATTSSGVRVEG